MKSVVFIFSLVFHTGHFLHSQEHQWKITFTDGREFSTQFLQLDGDSIVLKMNESDIKIPIESIVFLRKTEKSKTGKGMGLGFLGGAVVGGIIGSTMYVEPKPDPNNDGFGGNWDFGAGPYIATGAVIGGLSGLIIGGIVGASRSFGVSQNLSKMTLEDKLKFVRDHSLQSDVEWTAVEINFSDIVNETDTRLEIRINNKPVTFNKSDIKIIRKTTSSVILALPTPLYKKIF